MKRLALLTALGSLLLAGCGGVPPGQGYLLCQYHRGVDEFPDDEVLAPGVGHTVVCKDGRVFHIRWPK